MKIRKRERRNEGMEEYRKKQITKYLSMEVGLFPILSLKSDLAK
jgi:nitrate reductase NapE component